MPKKHTRILLVISNQLETDEKIYAKITEFRKFMNKFETLHSVKPKYFLLYVGPHVPSYALQTPDMVQYATAEFERGKQILHNSGHILNIAKKKQFAMMGNSNLQALRVAKLLKVDKVLGYSKMFVRLLSAYKILTHGVESIFKFGFNRKVNQAQI